MTKKIKKIGVLTSGGDAPGMNAAIRAVVRTCVHYNVTCVGIYEGYKGLIENNMIELDARSVANTINRGGTFLRSARCLEFIQPEGRVIAHENLLKQGIDALVVIGGDGSFTGALKLNNEFNFPVVGIPGTIDNDINGTDYTIGYDTALNTVVHAIDKIRDTASSHNRLFLVEVMGRDAGDIAISAGIGGGAEEILIPEKDDFSIDRLMESLEHSRITGKTSSIIIVAEGKKGMNILEMRDYVHKHRPEYDVRVSVLGHLQRGGAPSCTDRVLASKLGVGAVDALMKGLTNVMIGVSHRKAVTVDLNVALDKNRKLDRDLLRVADIVSL
ncbi:6-phosphofructokinase [Aquimarina agarivorans]|uniref:6-phosphofructokinase n=1 Tax=Aquimarina agarivorans TaxID=980584 RepID=UPI000248EB24|nr:6-phosphofructokinase [Aquimarina agarivorans]